MERAPIAALFARALSGSLAAPSAQLATDVAASADAKMCVKVFLKDVFKLSAAIRCAINV